MHLITLIGPPAVGKHTIAKLISSRTGYVLFHNHLTADLALSMLEYGAPGFFELMADLRLRCFKAGAQNKLRGMIFTCAYAFPHAKEFADAVDQIVTEHGGRSSYVRLTAELEALHSRVIAPERANYGKINDVEHLQRAIDEFNLLEVLPDRGDLTLNTSDLSAEEACREIVEHLIPQSSI